MTQHYNLYESLGLNPGESSDQLNTELSVALQALEEQGAGMSDPRFHETATARAILGEERRRAQYDAWLADSAARPMGIGDLIHLAERGQFPDAPEEKPRYQTLSIVTRWVAEVEPTGAPLARFRAAPGVGQDRAGHCGRHAGGAAGWLRVHGRRLRRRQRRQHRL